MAQYIVVLVTCPTKTSARRIAKRLLGERLAACVNVISGVESLFRWQGQVEQAREWLLLIKTAAPRVKRLTQAVLAAHPYEVPEIIALPITSGHPPYLRWIHTSLRKT